MHPMATKTNKQALLTGDSPEPGPLYERVKQYIIKRLESGEWLAGAQLPTEQELVATLGVSRMTVHRALRELSTEGRLSRIQGVGTFATAPVQANAFLEVRDIAEDITSRGHRHSAKLITLEAIRADLDMATTFELRPGAKIFHSVVVHYEDDTPIQLESRFVTPSFAPDYLQQDFQNQRAANYLQSIAPASEMEHLVFAISPDAATQKLLDIDAHEPCLLVVRRTWASGVPATKSLFTCPGSRFSLSTRQKL